jgi:hypothetical protein
MSEGSDTGTSEFASAWMNVHKAHMRQVSGEFPMEPTGVWPFQFGVGLQATVHRCF